MATTSHFCAGLTGGLGTRHGPVFDCSSVHWIGIDLAFSDSKLNFSLCKSGEINVSFAPSLRALEAVYLLPERGHNLVK